MKIVSDFLIKLALAEDIGPGDITTRAIVPKERKAKAVFLAKEDGIIAGLELAAGTFHHLNRKIKFLAGVKDGDWIKKGKIIAAVIGPAAAIITGERVALNFLQHLSGIATLTEKYVSKVQGPTSNVRSPKSKVKILDTRKTIPGMRALEKYAVRMGGGVNHRMGLHDAVLIKDNHIKIAGGIEKAIKAIKAKNGRKEIEVEARTVEEVRKAIRAGVDRILLDNMSIPMLKQAVKLCKKARIKTEASGGVNLNNVKAIAKTGVDFISVGALTHSAKALDISLKII